MNNRYFIPVSDDNLRAVVSIPLAEPPVKGILYYECGFHSPTFTDESCTVLMEGLTEEEISNIELEKIKAQYEIRKSQGWDAYQDFRGKMVVDINRGLITETQAMIIESYLGIGYDKIAQNGDWKTANYLLSQITISETHLFVQAYLTKALEIIQHYISENYIVRENQKPSK